MFPPAESDIHQSVRKPHFGSVYNAIADTLDERQKRRELRIEDKGIQASLNSDQKSMGYSRIGKVESKRQAYQKRIHGVCGTSVG